MIEQISLFLAEMTLEKLTAFGTLLLLWSPLVMLSFSSFYCGTVLLLQMVKLSIKQALWLRVGLIVSLAFVEGLIWYIFVFEQCYVAAGLELAVVTAIIYGILYLIGVQLLMGVIRKYGPEEYDNM